MILEENVIHLFYLLIVILRLTAPFENEKMLQVYFCLKSVVSFHFSFRKSSVSFFLKKTVAFKTTLWFKFDALATNMNIEFITDRSKSEGNRPANTPAKHCTICEVVCVSLQHEYIMQRRRRRGRENDKFGDFKSQQDTCS